MLKYKGLNIKYNEDRESEEAVKDFIDTLFEDYYNQLKGAKNIDLTNLGYIKIDGEYYTYDGDRLSDYLEDPELDESLLESNYNEYRELALKLNLFTNKDLEEFGKRHNCRSNDELIAAMKKELNQQSTNSNFYVDYLKGKGFSSNDIDVLVKDYGFFGDGEDPYDIDSTELAENIKAVALDELEKYIDYLKDASLEEFSKATFSRIATLSSMVRKLLNAGIKEDYEEDLPVNTEESDEDKPQTFEEKMDFLVADEQEAIDGYKEIIDTIDDEHVKEQLNKIMIEEEAHKAYLEKVKVDKSIDYTEPLEPEDDSEE